VFPVAVDIADVLTGYRRIVALAGSPRRVVPGHDPLFVQRYPALNSETEVSCIGWMWRGGMGRDEG
jgi:hypothetical protein